MIPANLRSNGPLVAASLYVVGVVALLSGTRADLPPAAEARLALAEVSLLARLIPPGGSHLGTAFSPDSSLISGLASQPFPAARDRYRGAAIAIRMRAPGALHRFLEPLAASDPLARILEQWAFERGHQAVLAALPWTAPAATPALFEPRPAAGPDEVSAAGVLDVEPGLREDIVRAVAEHAGMVREAEAAAAAAHRAWVEAVAAAAAVAAAILLLVLCGLAVWVRGRRSLAPPSPQAGPGASDILPLVRVLVFFLAVHLTTSLLIPPAIDRAGYVPDPAALLLGVYLLNGVAGLVVVRVFGAPRPGETFIEQVGLAGSFRVGAAGRSLSGAGAAWLMAWPAFLGASFMSASFGLGGDDGSSRVLAHLVSTSGGAGIALALASLGLAAPVVEEALFRGFVFRRLRARLSLGAAALASGGLFAAAHLSLDAFLPLAAIGFSFAVAYEWTRDLATPILAHALWNLAQAGLLLAVYA